MFSRLLGDICIHSHSNRTTGILYFCFLWIFKTGFLKKSYLDHTSELLDCLSLRHISEPLWIKLTNKHLCIYVFIDKHSRCFLHTANVSAALQVFGFSGGSVVKNLPANVGDKGSVLWSGRYPGVGNSNTLQYSCLETYGQRILAGCSPWVAESWTWLRDWARACLCTHTHTHTLSLLSQMLFYREVKVKSLSRVQLFATLWTVACQASPSMGFSRQKYWSGLPFPSPVDLPNPEIEPRSPTL